MQEQLDATLVALTIKCCWLMLLSWFLHTGIMDLRLGRVAMKLNFLVVASWLYNHSYFGITWHFIITNCSLLKYCKVDVPWEL